MVFLQRFVYFSFAVVHLLVNYGSCRTYSRNDSFIGYSEGFISASHHHHQGHLREFVIFTTAYGNITVRLFVHEAPKTVEYIKSLVRQKLFDGCGFYRVEPPGDTIDSGLPDVTRKGYALIQGGLYSCGKQRSDKLPVESVVGNKRGTVSLIAGTSEFFFNLEDHLEWNGSFTAWGQVTNQESWQVLKKIVSLPTREEVHPLGTVMRILLENVAFSVSLNLKTD